MVAVAGVGSTRTEKCGLDTSDAIGCELSRMRGARLWRSASVWRGGSMTGREGERRRFRLDNLGGCAGKSETRGELRLYTPVTVLW